MDGKNTGRMGFSHAAEHSAENMMAAVKSGKIRKQPLTFEGNVLKYLRHAKTLGKQSGFACLQERGSWWKPSARSPQATSFVARDDRDGLLPLQSV